MGHYQAAMPNARECLAGDCIYHGPIPELPQLCHAKAVAVISQYCVLYFLFVVTSTDTHDALLCSLQAGSAWHVTPMGQCHLPQQM